MKKLVLGLAILGLIGGGIGIGMIKNHQIAKAGDTGSQIGEDNSTGASVDEFFFLDPAVAKGKISYRVVQNKPGCDTPSLPNPDCETMRVHEKFTLLARQQTGNAWPFFAKTHGFKDGTGFIVLPVGEYKLQTLIYKLGKPELYRFGVMSDAVSVHAGEIVTIDLFHDRGGGL